MALNIKSDDLINVYNYKEDNNFYIPMTTSLKIGNLVKIANNFERFWVKIVEIKDLYILGEIDNHLTFNESYDYKDVIIFEKCNIFEVFDSNIKETSKPLVKKKKN